MTGIKSRRRGQKFYETQLSFAKRKTLGLKNFETTSRWILYKRQVGTYPRKPYIDLDRHVIWRIETSKKNAYKNQ